MKRKGRKTLEWQACRRKLKPRFERAGITTCELRYPGCWVDNGLGFCHRVKRRFITTQAELEVVILGCNHCHDIMEQRGHVYMETMVTATINLRSTPVPA